MKPINFLITEHAAELRAKNVSSVIMKEEFCGGPYNGRVCNRGVDVFLNLSETRCNPRAPQRRTAPTPWARMATGLYFTGNDYLDLIVYDLFFKARSSKGFYVEIGGSNGIHASNTLVFDDCLGWDGLLVETTQCAKCMLPYNRPRAIIENLAIGSLGSTFDARSMAAFCNNQGHPDCERIPEEMASVPCAPVQAIFVKHNITRVDFISIDIEESSEYALETIDLNATLVGVLLVECRQRLRCESKLRSSGFRFLWLNGDVLGWNPAFFVPAAPLSL